MNLELQTKVSLWRAKAIAGTLTPEEMAEAVKVIREGRMNAAAASAGATTKRAKVAAVQAINGDDLLGEMMA